MLIGTVVVSYKRPELLLRTLESYLDTVTLPYELRMVDNGGCNQALEVAAMLGVETVKLGENRFPGYSTNVGWDLLAALDPTYLHRSDNDVEYLPGWCDEVVARFSENAHLGQLGLRTLDEEGPHPNVGGNCVIRSRAFEAVRWQEGPWQRGVATEDYWYSKAVREAGFDVDRVRTPCIVHHGYAHPDYSDYSKETWAAKGYGGY